MLQGQKRHLTILERAEAEADQSCLDAVLSAEQNGYTPENKRKISDATAIWDEASKKLFDYCVKLEEQEIRSIPGADTVL